MELDDYVSAIPQVDAPLDYNYLNLLTNNDQVLYDAISRRGRGIVAWREYTGVSPNFGVFLSTTISPFAAGLGGQNNGMDFSFFAEAERMYIVTFNCKGLEIGTTGSGKQSSSFYIVLDNKNVMTYTTEAYQGEAPNSNGLYTGVTMKAILTDVEPGLRRVRVRGKRGSITVLAKSDAFSRMQLYVEDIGSYNTPGGK
jgi:hypothetical protein